MTGSWCFPLVWFVSRPGSGGLSRPEGQEVSAGLPPRSECKHSQGPTNGGAGDIGEANTRVQPTCPVSPVHWGGRGSLHLPRPLHWVCCVVPGQRGEDRNKPRSPWAWSPLPSPADDPAFLSGSEALGQHPHLHHLLGLGAGTGLRPEVLKMLCALKAGGPPKCSHLGSAGGRGGTGLPAENASGCSAPG